MNMNTMCPPPLLKDIMAKLDPIIKPSTLPSPTLEPNSGQTIPTERCINDAVQTIESDISSVYGSGTKTLINDLDGASLTDILEGAEIAMDDIIYSTASKTASKKEINFLKEMSGPNQMSLTIPSFYISNSPNVLGEFMYTGTNNPQRLYFELLDYKTITFSALLTSMLRMDLIALKSKPDVSKDEIIQRVNLYTKQVNDLESLKNEQIRQSLNIPSISEGPNPIQWLKVIPMYYNPNTSNTIDFGHKVSSLGPPTKPLPMFNTNTFLQCINQ